MNIKVRYTNVKVITAVLAGLVALYAVMSILSAFFAFRIPRLPMEYSLDTVGLDYQDVSFPSRVDGIKLSGWLTKGNGERAIVVVHGGFQTRVDDNVNTSGLARDLTARGYDILLFDQRGRGESQGKGRALTYFERDIGGAVDYLESSGYEKKNIVLLGFCSGAFSTLLFSSQEEVGAVVVDGCFATVEGMVIRQAAERSIPAGIVNIFIPGIRAAAWAMYHYKTVEPINKVDKVRSPLFFIHEERDDMVTWEETKNLYAAALNPADEIWQVPGAAHSQAYRSDPAEFIDRIDIFLTKSLSKDINPSATK
jgi:uncharacterized protein